MQPIPLLDPRVHPAFNHSMPSSDPLKSPRWEWDTRLGLLYSATLLRWATILDWARLGWILPSPRSSGQ